MPSSSEIARRYFDALSARDLDAAVACWLPGSIDRFVGGEELVAPQGIREYFAQVFGAFPDFKFEIRDLTPAQNRCAVRWKVQATFAGPGMFQGFLPNGAPIAIEGCDVVTVADDLITGNDAYLDTADLIRQLGFLPPAGSKAESQMAKLANIRTKIDTWVRGAEPESIADGVWVVRGGRPRAMNVYLIEDEGGLTMFDAGISDMTGALRSVTARMGGLKRVVLGHADCGHRGGAAAGMKNAAHVPHAAFNHDTETARASIRKLAALEPLAAWAGHANPVTGDVPTQLEAAALSPAT